MRWEAALAEAEGQIIDLKAELDEARAENSALYKVSGAARALYDVLGSDEDPERAALGAAIEELQPVVLARLQRLAAKAAMCFVCRCGDPGCDGTGHRKPGWGHDA